MKTPASTLIVANALCGILVSLSTASAGHVNTTGEPTGTSAGVQVVPVPTPSNTTPHSPSPAPNGVPATMGTDSEPNVHNGGVNLHPYTQEIKDYIVAQHNYARAFLTPSDAANMRQLKWNEALAIEASEHVNSCVFAHETEDYTYGQSLMYGNPQIDKPTVDRWIQAWVTDELSPSDRQGTGYLDLDHASAVLWATSYYVGCASNLCPKSYLTACNYYTPGNWVGEQTYIPGTPCSQCPSQAPYCDATGKLCTGDPPDSTQVPTPAPTTPPQSQLQHQHPQLRRSPHLHLLRLCRSHFHLRLLRLLQHPVRQLRHQSPSQLPLLRQLQLQPKRFRHLRLSQHHCQHLPRQCHLKSNLHQLRLQPRRFSHPPHSRLQLQRQRRLWSLLSLRSRRQRQHLHTLASHHFVNHQSQLVQILDIDCVSKQIVPVCV